MKVLVLVLEALKAVLEPIPTHHCIGVHIVVRKIYATCY